MSLRTFLNSMLKNTAYRIEKINPALNLHYRHRLRIGIEHILARTLLEGEFFFVQIGANDGVRFDDSHHFITRNRLKGIVVEPLSDMFENLSKNYAEHPQIIKVNAAIHAAEKSMTLYRIRQDAPVPDWCHGIASFDKRHLLQAEHKIPNLASYIIEEEVPCVTIAQLLEQHEVDKLTFLQIDTEGYDFEVIKSLDFSRWKPQVIRYECASLSPADNLACIELLIDQGYQLLDDKNDIIAVK
jgi:FkbM family methyltransferase